MTGATVLMIGFVSLSEIVLFIRKRLMSDLHLILWKDSAFAAARPDPLVRLGPQDRLC
jgi:hypothetical protein